MIYYAKLDDVVGTLNTEPKRLLPKVIHPASLTDAELATHGVGRVTVVREPVAWHQQRGEPTVEGAVVTYPAVERSLEEIKTEVAEKIDAERDERFEEGFTFATHRYQTRQQDRENIAGAVQLATLALMNGADPLNTFWHGGEQPFMWIREDNELTVMDAATMIAFGQAAAAHKHALIFQARGMKNAVTVAGDIAGVIAAMEWV